MARENKILEQLRYRYSLAEMQVMAGGAMGHDLYKEHLADILRPQVLDPQSAIALVVAKDHLKIDLAKLLRKLDTADMEEIVVLQRQLEKVLEQDPAELFGHKRHLPSAAALRVAGLVAPTDKAAWGFYILCLEDEKFDLQVVLRINPGEKPARDVTALELARDAVDIARRDISSTDRNQRKLLVMACGALALETGWRYGRVNSRSGQVILTEISASALQHDLADGSLQPLVLQGVNAPYS